MPEQELVGVDDARSRLGRLVEQVAYYDDVVVLTHRGLAKAVIISMADFRSLTAKDHELEHEKLRARLAEVRWSLLAAGLDVSAVDEAIAAAKANRERPH